MPCGGRSLNSDSNYPHKRLSVSSLGASTVRGCQCHRSCAATATRGACRCDYELTDGRVGYLHIPDMGAEGIQEFIKWFYGQIRKEGLIIDVRGNGGGNGGCNG